MASPMNAASLYSPDGYLWSALTGFIIVWCNCGSGRTLPYQSGLSQPKQNQCGKAPSNSGVI